MRCPKCDTELGADESTCPSCGLVIETDPTVAYVPVHERPHPALTPEEARSVAGIEGYALVVEKGPRAGMTFLLHPGSTSVGRHPDSDIFLDDVTVSRHHCRFTWEDDELVVEDSGSTNGTYVNGSRIDRTTLQPGDEVLIGRFHLIVARGHG